MTDAFDRYAEPADRLKWARKRAGYDDASSAARAFGWKPPTYLAHENGSRGLPYKRAIQYAKAFRVTAAWLMSGEGAHEPDSHTRIGIGQKENYQPKINDYGGISRVPIIGNAAPGVWQDVIAEESMTTVESVEAEREAHQKFAVTLADSSMNRRFPDGTTLICANADGPDGPIRDGDTVVAERYDGGMVERRVAVYRCDAAGQEWLWPDSNHRDHQAPLPLSSSGPGATKVIGIVLASSNVVERGRG